MTITIFQPDATAEEPIVEFAVDESIGRQSLADGDQSSATEDDNDDDILNAAALTSYSSDLDALITALPVTLDSDQAAISQTALWRVTSSDQLNGVTLTGVGGAAGTTFDKADYDSAPGSFDWSGGLDSGLKTLDGNRILLYSGYSSDGSNELVSDNNLDGNTLIGIEEDTGDVVLIVQMTETVVDSGTSDLQFSLITFEPVQHELGQDPDQFDQQVNFGDFITVSAAETIEFDFVGTPSGQNAYTLVVDNPVPKSDTPEPIPSDDAGLIVTGDVAGQTVNTSKGGGDFTLGRQNQMVDPDEITVFTFVDGPDTEITVPNLDQNEADDVTLFDMANQTFHNSDGASVIISQVQGNSLVTMQLTLAQVNTETTSYYDAIGFDGFNSWSGSSHDDTAIEIETVTVSGGTLAGPLVFNRADLIPADDGKLTIDGITVDFEVDVADQLLDLPVEVSGLDDGMKIEVKTDGTVVQRMFVAGVEGKWDIGGAGLTTPNSSYDSVGQSLIIEDSGPSASITDDGPGVTHDETPEVQTADGADDVSNATVLPDPMAQFETDNPSLTRIGWAQSSSAIVSIDSSYGFDGAGFETTELVVGSADTGLFSNGEELVLTKETNAEGDVIVGRTETSNDVVLVIYVDSSQILSIAQYDRIDHGDPLTATDNKVTMADGALVLQHTIEDADTDTVVVTEDIGDKVMILDDVPVEDVEPEDSPNVAAFAMGFDETAGATERLNDDSTPTETAGPIAPDDDEQITFTAFGSVAASAIIGQQDTTSVSGGLGILFKDGPNASDGTDGQLSRSFSYKFKLVDEGDDGVKTTMVTTANQASVWLFLQDLNGDGVDELVGREGSGTGGDTADSGGAIAFFINILNPDQEDAQLEMRHLLAIDHDLSAGDGADDPTLHDESYNLATATAGDIAQIEQTATRTDNDNDESTDSAVVNLIESTGSPFDFEDDGPKITVGLDAEGDLDTIRLNPDETIDPDGNDTPGDGEDTYNTDLAETESVGSTPNGDADDPDPAAQPSPALSVAAATVIGSLSTGVGDIAAFFDTPVLDYGRDGEAGTDPGDGRTDSLSFALTGDENDRVETTLSVTPLAGTDLEGLTDLTIWLVPGTDDQEVLGMISGDGDFDTTGDNYLAFRLYITDHTDLSLAKINIDHYLPIDHGADGNLFDSQAVLTALNGDDLLELVLTSTATDKDGDVDVDEARLTLVDDEDSIFSFDDDGPTAVITEHTDVTVAHDETPGVQGDPNSNTDQPAADDQPNANLPSIIGDFVDANDLANSTTSTLIGWALSASAVVTSENSDFGSDFEGSVVWELDVGATDDSGLTDLNGDPILLQRDATSGLVIGRVDTGGDGFDSTDPLALILYLVDDGDPDVDGDGTTDDAQKLAIAQFVPIKHGAPGSPTDDVVTLAETSLIARLTVTDGDTDYAVAEENIGDRAQIIDDEPDALNNALGSVFEDALSGGLNQFTDTDADGIPDTGGTPPIPVVASLTLNLQQLAIDSGTDTPAKFSWVTDQPTLDALAVALGLTSGGVDVTLSLKTTDTTNDTLVAKAGSTEVFTFQLKDSGLPDALQGDASVFTLLAPLDHDKLTNDLSLSIDLNPALNMTDADDDPATPTFAIVEVFDDIPELGTIDDLAVDFEINDTDSALLFDPAHTPPEEANGADVDPTFKITAYTGDDEVVSINGVTLTVTLEQNSLGDADSLVRYFADNTEDASNTVGVYDAGIDTLFYTYELVDTGADGAVDSAEFKVWTDPPPVFQLFDFDDLPAGQNLFGIVGDTDRAIVVLPENPDINDDGTGGKSDDGTMTKDSQTVNSSKGSSWSDSVIANSNNSFDQPGEGLWISFINDPDPHYLAGYDDGTIQGLDQNEADDSDNLQWGSLDEKGGAFFQIAQAQVAADVTLSAFDLNDNPLGRDYLNKLDVDLDQDGTRDNYPPDAGTVQVSIDTVRIYSPIDLRLPGTDLSEITPVIEATRVGAEGGDVTGDPSGVSIDFQANGEVEISGLAEGWIAEYVTDDPSDTLLIHRESGKFDIGFVGVAEITNTPDQNFDFTVEVSDFDQDPDSASHSVLVDGTGDNDSGEFGTV